MKKKKYNKFALLSIIVLLASLVVEVPTSLAYVKNGSKWSNPTSLQYYVDSSTLYAGNEHYATWGATAWNSATEVEVSRTYSSSDNGRLTTIVTSTTDLGAYYAEAFRYNSSGSRCVQPTICTVVRGKIVINNVDFKKLSSTGVRRHETMTHEMGHILGLGHEDSSGVFSIMLSGGAGFIDRKSPTTDDFKGISAVY
ncbi:matrixin family metalloprotease [Mangrovibacillus cuniculi]|uniref:Matrixin family metalloprotease n=1 Tax=Mangrovibacillus cuniculi TaxID=2593652 RepID=A0A7S8HEP3_9BACI|nr:matrixin family metalloprotease [Mangrovibacillus cuniculi]QPC45605.1 matrixin family metalloprotease [Mangrovibacillus cuniculi]